MQIAYFDQLYKTSDFMPHGECLMWTPQLVWTHVGSDLLTGVAYYLIATLLCYFIVKRRDTPYPTLFLLFGAFLLSCGTTHFMAAWTVYYPSYWSEGVIKIINAVISSASAIVLIPFMPKILTLPSLKKANDKIIDLNFRLSTQLAELTQENKKRKQAEEALRLTRISVEVASDALFWITSDARIVDVNEAACRSLGYPRAELLQLKVPDVDPLYNTEVWQHHFLELRKHGTLKFESEHRAKDGTVFPVEIVANYVKFGEEGYNCAFVRDITERKRTEQERKEMERRLLQSQKMEAIGTLAGGIAHDFNNILAIIYGYTELTLEENDPEKRRQNLKQVRSGAERAKELVKQILTFSRRTDQERQPLQIALVIKEALKLLRSSIPATIEIRQDIASNATVLADPTQIHQVIMNLCANSYHAMRETGGTLAVSLTEIEIRDDDEGYGALVPGRYLKLEVSDTGGGISPDIRDKIFEPYFTTKKTGEGTGLGLAVVHGIVKSHNGHIDVYSEPGGGTTFHVYLPLIEEEAAELPDMAPIADDLGKGERIMFVDDEAQIREVGDKIFSMHGYQVITFSNGVQALEEFQARPDQFDLVITDMAMPYMSGAELAQKILGLRPDMPIILCTGQSELINREKALAIGACDYLIKPILRHDYLSAIRKALDKKPSPAPLTPITVWQSAG